MEDSDVIEVSDDTAAVLDQILRARLKALRSAPSEVTLFDTRQMVYYLCGELSEAEVRKVERHLLISREARVQLLKLRAALISVQSMTWAAAAKWAEEEGEEAVVAHAWLDLVRSRVASAPHAPGWWSARDWMRLRQEIAEGVREAREAWASFLAFGEQWKMELHRPRVALARGGGEFPVILIGPTVEGRVDAEVLSDGALHATLRLTIPAKPERRAELIGKTARLSLSLHGEVWSLAAQTIEGAATEFLIPGLGTALRLPPGIVPSALLTVTIDESAPIPPQRLLLLAEVLDGTGQVAPGSPIAIELKEAPRWEAEHLILTIALPTLVRDAYPTHQLELDLLLSPGVGQRLGLWPVENWGDAPLKLEISCPGCQDAAISSISFLRARLRVSDEV